jgi:Probable zinc-ribbon domain
MSMNGKQKRIFLKAHRQAKRDAAKRLRVPLNAIPKGAIAADRSLHAHINSYSIVDWYVDQPFTCRDCGITEIWKAAKQKRYVESWGGHTAARATRCSACRKKERERKAEARARSEEGLRLKLS